MFTKRIDATRAAGAKVVVLENADGVVTLAGNIALKQFIDNAAEAGFAQLFHNKLSSSSRFSYPDQTAEVTRTFL